MKFAVGFLSLIVIIFQVKCVSAEDESQACMIKILKEKELLNEDFSYPRQPTRCFLAAIIITAMEDGFYSKFDNEEGINADCVKSELKKKNLVYHLIKKDIIESSKTLSEEEIKSLLNENKETMKSILNSAAKACKSDDKWGGIFDDVLDIKNTTHAALESNYCCLKTSIDKNLIKIENIDVNPYNFDTSNVDCNAIIENKKNDIVRKFRAKYNESGLSQNKINCIVNNLNESNFFDTTIALKTLEKIDLEPFVRAENKRKLSNKIEAGITGIFSCMIENY
ncbi:unnamed protein product [Chironomus riparius]|uniref:Uncharacterized protein n=1 Tax=Chironomus riparius TaxID=315576 RepID=A0A9N9WPD2_9DIPT|nr:unnamed protein product [Chironomus riparius]